MDLRHEIIGGDVGEKSEQFSEDLRLAIGKQPGRRLVRRAFAGNHVGRHRPGRAAEAEQGGFLRQFTAQATDRLEHRLEVAKHGIRLQGFDAGHVDRIHLRSMAFGETHIALQCIGNDQNIGKQDRGVEAVTTDRLQRHFRCKFRRITQIEKTAGFGAGFPVLRQIPAGLAHQPDGRRTDGLTIQHSHDLAVVGQCGFP